ncbi:MAG: hypothetical protein HOG03_11645 [Desulfobacula sp.]|jgi:hypothetical protein|uniref:hypothetical protein n=1 Tax=Desulfobacula sp. TaxID=2593537 RepID=UPI001DE77C4B|nr:hypothetical protein [Desulfobacula sp.]MBT3484105.1 hypothetical protein [Desulfobacula sp.]MBT3805237.1 hypothetical protein [Desulfobacula sp.]MBT4024570.1 hypothetical protein [Desulfobacula sp.]MBT4199886.1 hypothetical protein [Desulfobacula sp.]
MMFPWITAIQETIGGAFGIIKEPIVEWQKRKTIKAQAATEVEKLYAMAAVKKAEVVVEMAKQGQAIEADWDAKAQEQAKFSWKDEALMLLLFFPVLIIFISPFIPGEYQEKIIDAVAALEKFPTWYVVMLLGIVASVFGLRWLIAPLVQKMNAKN